MKTEMQEERIYFGDKKVSEKRSMVKHATALIWSTAFWANVRNENDRKNSQNWITFVVTDNKSCRFFSSLTSTSIQCKI